MKTTYPYITKCPHNPNSCGLLQKRRNPKGCSKQRRKRRVSSVSSLRDRVTQKKHIVPIFTHTGILETCRMPSFPTATKSWKQEGVPIAKMKLSQAGISLHRKALDLQVGYGNTASAVDKEPHVSSATFTKNGQRDVKLKERVIFFPPTALSKLIVDALPCLCDLPMDINGSRSEKEEMHQKPFSQKSLEKQPHVIPRLSLTLLQTSLRSITNSL